MTMTDPDKPDAPPKKFTFDFAFGMDSLQETVYEKLGAPVIVQALEGFNSTIFAYGQTGSGKTHSMMGSPNDRGIIPRLNEQLFGQLESKLASNANAKFLVTVSYLEIYNEVIKDLLNPSDKQLKIREHPQMGIYVQSLAELVVSSGAQLSTLIEQGNSVRQVAATQMNERSSRSHSCFTIKIEQKDTQTIGDVEKEKILKSKLNLVDLAGSERASKTGATGDRLKEGAAINKSLAALGNVINSLADAKPGGHVPYRDSKLTRLLQESLGGNSKTCMVAAVSPADYNYEETLSTLQYAHRAKAIKNAATINEDLNERVIRELQEEIERMKKLLEQGGGVVAATGEDGGEGDNDEEKDKRMEEMQEAIANLERAKTETWEEKERLASAFEEERQRNLGDASRISQMMETVKEEKMEGMRRIKKLKQQKVKLVKGMRRGKEEYDKMKKTLKVDMGKYKEAMEGGAGEENEQLLQTLLPTIENKRAKLTAQRDFISKVKDKLEEVEERLTTEEVEMAAYSSVVASDEVLRKQVEEEVHAKFEKEQESHVAAMVEKAIGSKKDDMKKEIEQEIDAVREGLVEVFAKGASEQGEREQKLEMELLESKQKNGMLAMKMQKLQKAYTGLQQQFGEQRRKSQQAMRDVVMCMEKENATAKKLLQQAVQDAVFLAEQNKQLQRRLQQELAYEPDN